MNRYKRYIVEMRDAQGNLDFEAEREKEKVFGKLFRVWGEDSLFHYLSYGQGRNMPVGPYEAKAFLESHNITMREVTW